MSILAICADSHDNMPNIEKFLKYCRDNKIKTIIHCGDVTTKQTRSFFTTNFNGTIYFANGNAEISSQKPQKRTNKFQKIKRNPVPFVEIIENNVALAACRHTNPISVAACHQRDKALRLARTNKYDFVFYGHSHKPWKDKVNNTILINPGTLAGMFYRATFATFDTSTNQAALILVDTLN
ncbi:MAG: YfcE family phosphodiesterase [Candidatus Falkowbacteria bacterium]